MTASSDGRVMEAMVSTVRNAGLAAGPAAGALFAVGTDAAAAGSAARMTGMSTQHRSSTARLTPFEMGFSKEPVFPLVIEPLLSYKA